MSQCLININIKVTKNLGAPRIEPGRAGCKAQTLPLCFPVFRPNQQLIQRFIICSNLVDVPLESASGGQKEVLEVALVLLELGPHAFALAHP